MEENITKIDIAYAEKPVRFSIRGCHHKRDYSVQNVDTQALPVLLNRLKRLEDDYTWKMLSALPREQGLSKEIKDTPSYEMIRVQKELCEGPDMGDGDYYFHIRVKNKDKQFGLFRVFGYQKGDMFCITHFDVKGTIHH